MTARFMASQPLPARLMSVLLAAMVSAGVQAQSLRIEPFIATNLVYTDNARFSDASVAVSDVYLELMPRLNISWASAYNRLSFEGGVDAVAYAHGSESTRTVPVARAEWASTLIERALFLDASARLDQRTVSPYASQSVNSTLDRQVSSGEYRLSPHFAVGLTPEWLLAGRSDHLLTHLSGPLGANETVEFSGDAYAENTFVRLGRLPRPLGMGLELQRQRLNYLHVENADVFALDAARMLVAYAVNSEWMVTALGGSERSTFSGQTTTDADVGLGLRWTPMPRSEWSVQARRRFFGNGYKASWVHRAAGWAASVVASREPVANPGASPMLAVDGYLAEDTERPPAMASEVDPTLRAQELNDTLEALGLPPQVSGPVNVYTLYPQLSTGGAAILTFTGRRTVLAFNVFARQLETLQRAGVDNLPTAPPLGRLSNLRQYGAQAGLDVRITPMTTFATTLRAYKAQSLTNAVDESTDGWLRLGLSFRLSPHTRAGVGVEHHRFNSTLYPSATANSVAASLNYRF